MKINNRAFLAALAGLVMIAGGASAEMRDAGYGPRAIAMGQAAVASVNDASAVSYNPAALTYARDYWNVNGRTLWAQIGKSGYSSHLALNGVDQQYSYTSYTTLGLIVPATKWVTIGVNVSFCDDWFLYTLISNGPRFSRYTPTQQVGLGYGFALRLTKKLSIGYTGLANFNFNFSPVNLDLSSLLSGLGLPLGVAADLNPHMEVNVLSTSSYQLGLLYRPFKWINLGLNYAYKNPNTTIIPIYIPAGLLPETRITVKTIASSPTSLSFGVAIFPNEHMTFAFDLTDDMWSHIAEFWQFSSDNPTLFNAPLNVTKMKDVWIPKFGFEYKGNLKGKFSRAEYALRAGYMFYKSPYPTATATNKEIDNDAHYYTGGFSFGYRPLKRPSYLGVDYYYEYIDLVKRSHRDITRTPAVITSEGYIIYTGFALTLKI